MMKNNDELQKMRSDAKKTVFGFVTTATASCAVPIPVADAVVLVGEQVAMMAAISAIYKLGLSKKTLQTLLMGVLSASGLSVVGKTIVSSAFKIIPGVGTVTGSVISAGTAGALTLALGNAFIELCEAVKKGKLTEKDLEGKKGKDYFKKLFDAKKQEKEVNEMGYERPEGQGFGIIKKSCDVVKDGERGTLIWDYLVVNEITFVNARTKESESLYKGWSDEKTEKEYDRLSKLYALKNEKDSSAKTHVCEVTISGLSKLKDMEPRSMQSLSIHYGNKLIGYIEVTSGDGKRITIKEIEIAEEYRGKGIYTVVLNQLRDLYTVELAQEVVDEEQRLN